MPDHHLTVEADDLGDAVRYSLRHIDETMERLGWDRSPELFYLRRTTDSRTSGVALDKMATFDGHPADELVGSYAPDDVDVVILALEAWAYPDDATPQDAATLRPSQHPRRVEERVVIAVGRDGLYEVFRHVRGEPHGHLVPDAAMPANAGMREIRGSVYEALRIHMGAEPHCTIPTPHQGMQQIQILRVADMLRSSRNSDAVRHISGDVAEAVSGALIMSVLTGEMEQLDVAAGLHDEIAELAEASRLPMPSDDFTWEDMRRYYIDSLRQRGTDPKLLSYYEWADTEGFIIDVLNLADPFRGDAILELLPETMRRDAADRLNAIGIPCSDGLAGR
jgi:hypothetical protein